MRNLCILYLFLFSFKALSQSQEHLNFNQEYNNTLYLCKESWSYLEKNKPCVIMIYSSNNEIIKTFKFSTSRSSRDFYMNKIMSCFYLVDEPINKIKIDNKIIAISNNDIRISIDSSIHKCIEDHASFCQKHDHIAHNQGDKTYNDRLEEFGLNSYGIIAENCSRTQKMSSERLDIRRILRAYFLNRRITPHWNQFMNKKYTTYTTAIKSSSDYVYSVTIFH